MLHGTTDHTTEECKVLRVKAKRMKASWDTTDRSVRRHKSNKYKSNKYKRHGGDNTKEEANAMEAKVKELTKKVNQLRKRRDPPVAIPTMNDPQRSNLRIHMIR